MCNSVYSFKVLKCARNSSAFETQTMPKQAAARNDTCIAGCARERAPPASRRTCRPLCCITAWVVAGGPDHLAVGCDDEPIMRWNVSFTIVWLFNVKAGVSFAIAWLCNMPRCHGVHKQ